MDADAQPPQNATTLLEILDELRAVGFGGQFIAQPDGRVKCTNCSSHSAPADLAVSGYRRVEGASDAADLNLVVWASCPSCSTGGVLTLGYGPNATASDEAVLDGLDLDRAPEPGATPGEAS